MGRAVRELGRLDIVVNNAGVAKVAPLAEMTPDDWRFMVDANLTGVFNRLPRAAPHLIAQKSGQGDQRRVGPGAGGAARLHHLRRHQGGVIALTRPSGSSGPATESR